MKLNRRKIRPLKPNVLMLNASMRFLLCAGITSSFMLHARANTQDVVLIAAEDAPKRVSSWSLFSSAEKSKNTEFRGTFGEYRLIAEQAQKLSPAKEATDKSADKQDIKLVTASKATEYISSQKQISRQDRERGEMGSDAFRVILANALKRAVERSPSLKQASAALGAANADVREAQGQRWPQIDVSANSRSRSLGGGSNNVAQAVNLNMTTTVYDWGRTGKLIDSRKELSAAAVQKYMLNVEILAQDVTSTLLEKEKASRVANINQQYAERMKQLVDMLADIVAVDNGRASELVQARARLLEAESSKETWLARERDAEIKLYKLIGKNNIKIPKNIKFTLPDVELEKLLSVAQNHPALLQAEAEAKASKLQAESLRAAEKPQVNWVVTKSTGKDDFGREDPWQTMVTVSWPIFRGGSATAAREAALLRAEADLENKEQQQMDLEFEARAAVQDANTLLTRANLYINLIAETERVKTAFFDQWYNLGRRTLLDVLIAESDYNNNRINEVSYRFDSYLAVVKAYGSTGMLSRWLFNDLSDVGR
ncbi:MULTISPECIES: TolC family protein [unclassified Serratia (in: enterobacteria)]|uniref:TolC family protein n=1 Tax=unclassified Serratia (in: enterobacteria) TaxID=2647522 RepID=UPI0009DF88BB|nr:MULTISPECIES: TolC family protein [unclassified Serratia (in: enterobacteria)]